MDSYLVYLTLSVSVVLSALFSGIEISYLSANRLRLEIDRQRASLTSRIVQIYLKSPSEFIATILVGNNVVLVIYGMAMATVLNPLLRNVAPNDLMLLITETLLSTFVILMLGEFIPKALFRLSPNGLLKFFSLPLFPLYVVLYPLTRGIGFISRGLVHLLSGGKRVHPALEGGEFGRSDLNALVDRSCQYAGADAEGEGTDSEVKIFQNALQFSEVKVRDCLVPRTDIQAVEVNASLEELTDAFIESSFSRLPIYEGSIDNIIGYVNAKSLFLRPATIREIVRPLAFIPETMRAKVQLTQFIRSSKSMAVVVDEVGGTAGLVTMEDLIEEIFGEINDEHDTQTLIMNREDDGSYLFSGRAEVTTINELFGLDIPESDSYDTIAGFILENHPSIPRGGDVVTIEEFTFRVLQVDGRSIQLVRLSLED